MKNFTLALLVCCAAATASAGEAPWLTSLPQAATQASKENKLLLLDFTGSDWCGWCKKLDADTFSKPEFIDYASKNLVLVQLDFPAHKPQPADLKQANRELKDRYGVQGFPTVIVLKAGGGVLWQQSGYLPGGPAAMIDAVNRCRSAIGLPVPTESTPVAAPAPVKAAPQVAVAQPQQLAPPAAKPYLVIKLQGILFSASHPCAVISGKSCSEGDTVYGMRIVKIARDQVTVESRGQLKVLTLD